MAESGNIYAAAREHVWTAFGERLSGSRQSLVLACCARPLADDAREALRKTAAALGYGDDAVAFAQLEGLSPADAFELVEGCDPLAVVACDLAACSLLSECWRTIVAPGQPLRAFCRDVRAFDDLSALMDSQEGKQQAWAQLKSLPKFPG